MPGKVIVQTYNPDSFAIEYSKKQDYDIFFKTEIELRKQLNYPPFCDIIMVGFTGTNEEEIKRVSKYMYELLRTNLQKYEINIFMPVPAPIDKIQGKLRWRIIGKGKVTDEVNIIMNKALRRVFDLNLRNTKVVIDINPNNMM